MKTLLLFTTLILTLNAQSTPVPATSATVPDPPKLTETQSVTLLKLINTALSADNTAMNRYVQFQQEKSALEKRFQEDMEKLSANSVKSVADFTKGKEVILKEMGCESCDIDYNLKVTKK